MAPKAGSRTQHDDAVCFFNGDAQRFRAVFVVAGFKRAPHGVDRQLSSKPAAERAAHSVPYDPRTSAR